MKDILHKYFLKEPGNWIFWVIMAFLFKGLFFIFLLCKHDYSSISGFWGGTGGDTETYLLPIDNFIKTGNYFPDLRMPGYGILYLPLAFLFHKLVACNLLISLQFIVAALTVYPLALIAWYLFKSKIIFYLTFYCFAISSYSNLFDDILLTESFTTSFLILSIFFLLKSLQEKARHEKLDLFLSGLLFTETFFLRPVFIPLVAVFMAVLLLHHARINSKKNMLLRVAILLTPILIGDGSWIVRNFAKYHVIIPTMKSIYSPQIENSYLGPLYTFVQSWGGSEVYWDPSAEIRWFIPKTVSVLQPQFADKRTILPDYIYTSAYNYDTLQSLEKQLSLYLATGADTLKDSLRRKALLAIIRAKCKKYANSVRAEKPLLYYVTAPLILTKKFLIHSGTYNLFNTPASKLNGISFSVKVFYSMLYLVILALGAIAIVVLSKKSILLFPIHLL